MQLREKKLKTKGWSDEEIDHAREILLRAEEKKHPKKILLEKTIFWIMMIVIITATILGAWIIEPLLLITTQAQASIAMGVFGLLFGSLATILFRDIEELKLHHHLISFFIIPLSAIITATIISFQALKLAKELHIAIDHNPLLLGTIYALSALLPYIIFISVKRKEHATH